MKFKPQLASQRKFKVLGQLGATLLLSGLSLQACQVQSGGSQASAESLAEQNLGQSFVPGQDGVSQADVGQTQSSNQPLVAQSGCGPGRRSKFRQPFACDSIWNMPIGSGAKYVDAGIEIRPNSKPSIDEDILVLEPDAPLTPLYFNSKGWSQEAHKTHSVRCAREGDKLAELPIPHNFFVEQRKGTTENNAAAILMADERTLYQTQPFQRCRGYSYQGQSYATSKYEAKSTDIYGQGLYGAHGGSRLSSIGGTIRIGELAPGKTVIPHALKINLWGKYHIAYRQDDTVGYRWPAAGADAHADSELYGGKVPELEMGALLALKPDFDLSRLQTEPAKIIARTLQDYGGYVVDNTGWRAYALAGEYSPDGRLKETFKQNWGFHWRQKVGHPWEKDMRLIFNSLHVVDNNAPNSVGGGGKPRAPLAPAISD